MDPLGSVAGLQLVPYDPDLLTLVEAYAADVEHVVDDEAVVVRQPQVGKKVWRAAKQVVGSGAAWGGLIPGVSLDCAGAVISVVTTAGLYTIPPGVLMAAGGGSSRHGDMEEDHGRIHRRLTALLFTMALRYAAPGTRAVPVINSNHVLPGDIFLPPYMAMLNGMYTYPHAFVCAAPGRLLHASPCSNKVEIVDVSTAQAAEDATDALARKKTYSVLLRCVEAGELDHLAMLHEAAILARTREMVKVPQLLGNG